MKNLKKMLILVVTFMLSANVYADNENNETNNSVKVEGKTTVYNADGALKTPVGVKATLGGRSQVNSIDVDQSGGSNHKSNNSLEVRGDTTVVGNAQVNSINVKQ